MDLKVNETKLVMVVGKDAKGNLVPIEGTPVWTSSNTELLMVVVQEDVMKANLEPVGPTGAVQVMAQVGEVVGVLDVNLLPGPLATLEIVPVE